MKYVNKAALIAAFAVITGASSANASLTFKLSSSVNGVAPTSTAPWLTALFEDVTGGVKLTLTSSLDVAGEYIDQVAFNVNPNITPSSISISELTTNSGDNVDLPFHNTSVNAQDLTGSGTVGKGFDIRIDWVNANANRFNGSDVEKFEFLLSGLTESDFNYANSSGLHIAAHIAGIPQSGGGTTSGLIADTTVVPEPSTYFAAALLALPLLAQVRRMRKAA